MITEHRTDGPAETVIRALDELIPRVVLASILMTSLLGAIAFSLS